MKNKKDRLSKILDYDLTGSRKRLSDKFKESLYSEFHLLLSSGIDLKTTLDIIIHEQKKGKHKEILEQILENVISGSTLSEAFENTGMFTAYEFNSIRIGEEGGSLYRVLQELSNFYINKRKHTKQILGSLSYPIFIMITAIVVVVFMLNVIVPMFKDVFARFNGELPGVTQFVIDMSEFMVRNSLFFILIPFVVYLSFYFARKSKKVRIALNKFLLRIPFVGGIVKAIYLERFCMSMELLISSKVSIINALDLVKRMIYFTYLEHIIEEIKTNVEQGESLYASMKEWKLFDQRFLSLVRMGEEVNKLDNSFSKLKEQYSSFLGQRLTMLGSFMEPVLIIFVGVIVAVILVSMYLPLFQVSTSIF